MGWFSFNTYTNKSPHHVYSYDENGYRKYYYYCEDVTSYLNTEWIPVICWFFVNILPHILLSLSVLSFKCEGGFTPIYLTNPLLIFCGAFSHLQFGPLSYRKTSGYLCFSKTFSYINILL